MLARVSRERLLRFISDSDTLGSQIFLREQLKVIRITDFNLFVRVAAFLLFEIVRTRLCLPV